MEIAIPPIPATSAPAQRPVWLTRGVVFLSLAVVTWSIALCMMLFVVPRYEEIFRDFGVALPALTRELIRTSRWLGGTMAAQQFPGAVIAVPCFLAVIAIPAVMLTQAPLRKAGAILSALLWLLGGALIIAVLIATHGPLADMTRSLQGGGGV